MQQAQALKRLMQDERVKALAGHPKVQALLRDPDFLTLVQSQDLAKISAHPKFTTLMQDPELSQLVAQLVPFHARPSSHSDAA